MVDRFLKAIKSGEITIEDFALVFREAQRRGLHQQGNRAFEVRQFLNKNIVSSGLYKHMSLSKVKVSRVETNEVGEGHEDEWFFQATIDFKSDTPYETKPVSLSWNYSKCWEHLWDMFSLEIYSQAYSAYTSSLLGGKGNMTRETLTEIEKLSRKKEIIEKWNVLFTREIRYEEEE